MNKILTINNPNEALRHLYKELERRTQYYWTTAKGEQVKLEDMTDTHLKNTIKYLENYTEEQRIVMENLDALDYYD